MGCIPSHVEDEYEKDQSNFESLISDHGKTYSEEELLLANEYLSKYESLYERLKAVMESIGERLIGKDPAVVYNPTPFELALAHLSGVMKRLKQNIRCYESEEKHYMQLAKEHRDNEIQCKMYLQYVSRCRKAHEAIINRMMAIETKIDELKNAEGSLSLALTMNEVADKLEDFQKDMATVEEFEALMDKMNELDDNVKDMDVIIEDGLDDEFDLDGYMEELNSMDAEGEDEKKAVESLPTAPTTLPKAVAKKTVEREAVRIAELEYIVC